MKKITMASLLIGFSFISLAFAQTPSAVQPQVFFHLVCKQDQAACTPIFDPETGRAFAVESTPSLTIEDIKMANYKGATDIPEELKKKPVKLVPQHKVMFELTNKGKRIFYDLTRNNVGRVYVILYNGQSISMSKIKEPVNNGRILIYASSEQKAQELIAAINQAQKSKDKK